ncbi:MAG: hypothetical protein ACLVJ6_17325 [Merdibacter sp.]
MSFETTVDGIQIQSNEELSEKCIYPLHPVENHNAALSASIDFDGDDVNLGYYLEPQGFEKIRRITGYLVGTVDRFNDAKRGKRDRVKHM